MFTDAFLGMETFNRNRETYFLKSNPLDKVKIRSTYKRYGIERIKLSSFGRLFDGMENRDELIWVGQILRELAFVDQSDRSDKKVHQTFSLFFYYCFYFNNISAAEEMWTDPRFAKSEYKIGPRPGHASIPLRTAVRKNRLIYYMLLYRNRMFSKIVEDAQPMLLDRDPKNSEKRFDPRLLDFDSATVVTAALAKMAEQDQTDHLTDEPRHDTYLADGKKLYDANMRYFDNFRGVKYKSGNKVPKYRLNYLYTWMVYSLGSLDQAYNLINFKYHYNQESRNLKLAILADTGRLKETWDFFRHCLSADEAFQNSRLGQRGQFLSFEAVMKVKEVVKTYGDETMQQEFDRLCSKFGRDVELDKTLTIEDIIFNPINISPEVHPDNKQTPFQPNVFASLLDND